MTISRHGESPGESESEAETETTVTDSVAMEPRDEDRRRRSYPELWSIVVTIDSLSSEFPSESLIQCRRGDSVTQEPQLETEENPQSQAVSNGDLRSVSGGHRPVRVK